MRTLLCVVLLVVSTLGLQAQTPEWLADLAMIAPAGVLVNGVVPTSLEVSEIRRIARAFRSPFELDIALRRLPTPERRDRAYKTLISFTRWQPKPGLTEFGHGGPPSAHPHAPVTP
jgi:hypothetical protein